MSSQARSKFEAKALADAKKLLALHKPNKQGNRGRQALGHLTGSAILMLCAGWEVYIEEIIIESVESIFSKNVTANNIPKPVQKALVKHLEEDKNELESFKLAGDGWKECLRGLAQKQTGGLHSPKSGNIDTLIEKLLGIKGFSTSWSKRALVDDFVKRRGEIAHGTGRYLTQSEARKFIPLIEATVKEIDKNLRDEFKEKFRKFPSWNV